MTTLSFPVFSFRNIEHPHGGKCYMAVLKPKDIPAKLEEWRGINPRDANPKDRVSREIFQTINETPEAFFFKNRGLVVVAKSAQFDQKESVLTLRLDDASSQGLL